MIQQYNSASENSNKEALFLLWQRWVLPTTQRIGNKSIALFVL